jgi:hypothetical protein
MQTPTELLKESVFKKVAKESAVKKGAETKAYQCPMLH